MNEKDFDSVDSVSYDMKSYWYKNCKNKSIYEISEGFMITYF